MTTNRSNSPSRKVPVPQAPSVLVLAQPSPETDDLLGTLVDRTDLCLLRVTNLNAAERALRDVAVSLVLVCPETDPEAVTAVLDSTEELRPGTPVLAFQPENGDPPPAWKGRILSARERGSAAHLEGPDHRCPPRADIA